MRIERFWAKNYRSLADVDIRFDGDIDVFYGKNGAGKSNIFRGLETLFGVLASSGKGRAFEEKTAQGLRRLGPDDRSRFCSPKDTVALGAALNFSGTPLRLPAVEKPTPEEVTNVVVEVRWSLEKGPWFARLELSGSRSFDLAEVFRARSGHQRIAVLVEQFKEQSSVHVEWAEDLLRDLMELLFQRLGETSHFSLVSDVRTIPGSIDLAEQPGLPGMGVPVSELLNQGRLAEALFSAKNSGDPDLNARWFDFQEFMQVGLDRPLLDVVTQPGSRQLRLVERVGRGFHPIDLAGLGIQQLYIMFAQIFLSGARCVAIEEPEAHLHMPDTGLTVRRLLRKALDDGEIDQLLIASHDSVFAMDTDAFLEVSLDEQGRTHVERNEDLTDIDRKHVYEPGPILRAVQGVMRDLDGDEVVHTRMDTGAPVTAREMLALIERADPVAREYMEQYQQFVIHLTRARARKPAATGP